MTTRFAAPEVAEAIARAGADADARLGYRVAKRTLDIVLSVALLVLLAPLLLLVAIAIRLDSRGPALFLQERLGRNGVPFRMVKFRSMRTDVSHEAHRAYVEALIDGEADTQENGGNGQVYKLVEDDRITRVGRIIRRTSIDELPQLLNVLAGTMSLVGPRPPLGYEVERYRGHHFARMVARPGVTGLWQVSGRNALGFEEMISLDLAYIRRSSMRLDLKILVRTLPAILRRTGA